MRRVSLEVFWISPSDTIRCFIDLCATSASKYASILVLCWGFCISPLTWSLLVWALCKVIKFRYYSSRHHIGCFKATEGLSLPYPLALSQQDSVDSFATMRVLRCLHSPGLRCSCCNVVRFCCDLEACNLVTTTAAPSLNKRGFPQKRRSYLSCGSCITSCVWPYKTLTSDGGKSSLIQRFQKGKRALIAIYLYILQV
jgi:hypothetical protein